MKDLPKATYADLRPYINDGDLFLWKGADPFSRIIQLFSYHSHASLSFEFHKFGIRRLMLYEALTWGVEPEFLSARINRYKGRVFWHPVDPAWNTYRPRIYEKAEEYGGIKYDFWGLIKNVAGLISTDVKRLICSEFAYLAVKNAGIPISNWQLNKAPRPSQLLRLGVWSTFGTEIVRDEELKKET